MYCSVIFYVIFVVEKLLREEYVVRPEVYIEPCVMTVIHSTSGKHPRAPPLPPVGSEYKPLDPGSWRQTLRGRRRVRSSDAEA